jgi:MYXO-CTERM domain-containing protein
MFTTHRGSLTLAFPLILAAALVPDDAEACPYYGDPCQDVDAWLDLAPRNAEQIPVDGVLVLQGNPVGAPALDTVALEVTLDGQPIAGALEPTPHPGALVWRPTEPWQAGATYQLAGTVTNPEGAFECAAPELLLAADLNIDTVPGAALVAPDFSGETMFSKNPIISIQSLACCEGTPGPYEGYGGCGNISIDFDPAECAPTMATGSFNLAVLGQPAADGPAAGQIVYTRKVGGLPEGTALDPGADFFALQTPICVSFDATDLVTGAVLSSPEQCFGEDLVDQLGPQSLDPSETLSCSLEQCGASGTCTPLDPDPDTTDTTDTDPNGDSESDSDTDPTETPPTSSDTTPDSTSEDPGTTAADSETAPTDPNEEGDKGCACATTRSPPSLAAALLTLGLLTLPRRRKRPLS